MAPLNPQLDAELINDAIEHTGTDEARLISVLTQRSNYYIANEVAPLFRDLYGQDLLRYLTRELKKGDFADLMIALATPKPDFIADQIKQGTKGLGTDEDVLIDVVCHTSNHLLEHAQVAYARHFKKSMVEEIKSDTSGSFRDLILTLCQGNRSEGVNFDVTTATRDAELLYSKGEGKWGTDEKFFVEFFTRRSIADLAAIDHAYEEQYKKPLVKAIESETSGDYRSALLALVKPKDIYFAERLHTAVKGLGTKEKIIIRVFALLDKQDLKCVDKAYQALYGKTLSEDLCKDTSSHFETALLALLQGFYDNTTNTKTQVHTEAV